MAKVNFKDDVLNASMNGKRQYSLVNNANGTVSLNDVTVYDQLGDDFGAKEVNDIGKDINLVSLAQIAGGTATAITLSNVSLVNGLIITFVVAVNNNGSATTINGKALYKPNTTQAPTLIAGKAVTVWYNGNNFFIKASAEGNAVAGDVLAGKTFSNDNDTGIIGTIPTATTTSPYEASSELYVANGEAWLRTQGNKYWPDKTWIKFNEPNLTPANIKTGVTIGSTTKITGTFTDDSDAVAANILSGKTAYVKGNKVTGNIPSKAAATITPKAAAQTIPAGQYLSGIQTIAGDANLVPANILQGKSIFGVAGNVIAGKKYASGSSTTSNSTKQFAIAGDNYEAHSRIYIMVSGLTFKPSVIVAFASLTIPYLSLYSLQSDGSFLDTCKVAIFSSGVNSNSLTVNYKANARDGYVNNTGFCIPTLTGSGFTCYWYAWE